MSRYRVGMRVRTSYNSGPYVIVQVYKGCTCPSFVDSLNLGDKAPKSRPHVHLICKRLDENSRDKYYLNGYDENLNSVWGNDYLIDLDEVTPIMLTILL